MDSTSGDGAFLLQGPVGARYEGPTAPFVGARKGRLLLKGIGTRERVGLRLFNAGGQWLGHRDLLSPPEGWLAIDPWAEMKVAPSLGIRFLQVDRAGRKSLYLMQSGSLRPIQRIEGTDLQPTPSLKLSSQAMDTVIISCRNYAPRKVAIDSYNQDLGTIALKKTNVIFVLADDLGWFELGAYGNTFNETPHLDALARQGMRFHQAYAAAPVCSPYRASLMSGQYPARTGITDYLRGNSTKNLGREHITLAEMFKSAGYATGIIGKWHLSGYASQGVEEIPPGMQGFDEVMSTPNRDVGAGDYWWPYDSPAWNSSLERILPAPEYQIDRFNHEAVEFLERRKDQPFFLYLSHMAVHTRLDGKPDLVAKYKAKSNPGKRNPDLAAMLEAVDQGIGMIMAKVKALGLEENTLVVFTSDNGGEAPNVTDNGILRAGKSTLYEGGIREPLLIHWPGVIPADKVCSTFTSSVDFYPTFAEALNITPDPRQRLDGVSILPMLKNERARVGRETIYWHYPLGTPHFLGGRSSGAIRQGDWKLIQFFDDRTEELYNIRNDIGESANLLAGRPAKANELRTLLAAWRKEVGATFPAGQGAP